VSIVANEHLDGDAGDGAGALVGDVAVEVGDLTAGEVGRLAHGKVGDGQAGGICVGSGGDGGDAGGGFAVLENQEDDGGGDEDDSCGDSEWQPVALAWFGGADQLELGRSAHERILHLLRKEYASSPRS